jgi:UDP-N-acetylmuramoyl-L-alanyl-D-glutamate--2,6-diaminopimelate ligase
MGAAASNLADRVIVTTDNPRSEDPDHIAQSIIAGAHGPTALESVPDRRSAILSAIDGRGESDVVVIAGKGHESTQVFATENVTFDDAAVATELLWGEAPC